MSDEGAGEKGIFGFKLPFFRREENQAPTVPEQHKLELPRNALFDKIGSENSQNLEELSSLFLKFLTDKNIRGAMIVVGGALEKPWPRKDIDIRIVLDDGKKRNDFKTYLELTQKKFEILQEMAGNLATSTGSQISQVLEPAIDEEFDNPAILKHEGTIQIKKEGLVPVEFLNTADGSIDNQIASQKKQFVVLARN